MKNSVKVILAAAAALIIVGTVISCVSLKNGADITVRRTDGQTDSVENVINEVIDRASDYASVNEAGDGITASGDYVGERWNEVSADNVYDIPVDGVKNLSIAWIAGGVEVKPASGDVIKFSENCETPLNDETALCWRVVNETLEIKYAARHGELPIKYLSLELPQELALENVDIDLTSGDIDAVGCNARYLGITSVSGNVIFKSLTADCLNIDTVSGDVQIGMSNAASELKINTVSGFVTLLVPNGTKPIFRFNTVSGNVTDSIGCKFAEEAAYNVETVSGDLQIAEEKGE